MAAQESSASIFSQKLDRVAFTAYFLGAVVPLVALTVVVERYVFPAITDHLATYGLIGLIASIAVLSLASFLTLRRTTRRSLDQIDGDNRRLTSLLEISGALATIEHGSDAAARVAESALVLAHAKAVFVIGRGTPGMPPETLASAGRDAEKIAQSLAEPLAEVTKLAMSGGRPVLKGSSRKGKGDSAAAMAAVPLPGDAVPAGAIVAVQPQQAAAFDSAEVDVLTTLAALASVSLRNADLHESQRNFFTHVTDILVTALDSHLGFHAGHGRRTAQYVNRVGREMGLDEHRLQRLHFAALLHDIGMLKIDRNQKMSRKSCAKHTVLGSRMLGRIRLWEDIAPIVHHHHEWWDGSGYPEGLSADAIPLEARIIAVCEVFDTLLSPTSYREAWTFAKSVHEIESGAATQFDPDVVAAFRRLVERGDIDAESPS